MSEITTEITAAAKTMREAAIKAANERAILIKNDAFWTASAHKKVVAEDAQNKFNAVPAVAAQALVVKASQNTLKALQMQHCPEAVQSVKASREAFKNLCLKIVAGKPSDYQSYTAEYEALLKAKPKTPETEQPKKEAPIMAEAKKQ